MDIDLQMHIKSQNKTNQLVFFNLIISSIKNLNYFILVYDFTLS